MRLGRPPPSGGRADRRRDQPRARARGRRGRFRADLLYRLRVGRIICRRCAIGVDDLPLLVFTSWPNSGRLPVGRSTAVSDEALQAMLAYDWPGNVRELKHAIGYAVIHAPGSTIELEDLPPESSRAQRRSQP